MSNNATVDPSQHRIRLGAYLLTGFAPDIGYSSTFDVDEFSTIVGNRGLGAFRRTISQAATITLNLMNTSQDNDFLSLMRLADIKGGGVLVPLTKTTVNNNLLVEGGLVRIVKNPDTNDGPAGIITWTLKSVNFTKFIAGYGPTITAFTREEMQAIIDNAAPLPAPV